MYIVEIHVLTSQRGSIMVNLSFTMGSKDRKDHMKKENGLQGVNTIMKGLQGARVMKYLS